MEKQDIVKLSKQLLSQPVPGIYFLYGGEEFLKRRFLSDLRKTVVPDDVADLNYAVVSGPVRFVHVSTRLVPLLFIERN